MKNNFFKNSIFVFKKAIFILSICAVSVSCTKSDGEDTTSAVDNAPSTIASQVSKNSSFSTLNVALVKSNLTTTLEGTGPFTVFAPTDDAFAASGIDATLLNSLTSDQVKTILLYHTVSSKIMSMDVPAGPNVKVVSAGGDSIFVTKNSTGVFVNGIKVKTPDITASNGVIHTISNVLMPPSGNIVQIASADTSFSFLVAAVVKASSGSNNVASLLSSGIFTIFAPTNNAFRAAGFKSAEEVSAVDADVLSKILKYHVVEGRIFTSDFTSSNSSNNSIQPFTLSDSRITITISSNGTPNIKGNLNLTSANLLRSNIMARNGIIHIVDQVLLD